MHIASFSKGEGDMVNFMCTVMLTVLSVRLYTLAHRVLAWWALWLILWRNRRKQRIFFIFWPSWVTWTHSQHFGQQVSLSVIGVFFPLPEYQWLFLFVYIPSSLLPTNHSLIPDPCQAQPLLLPSVHIYTRLHWVNLDMWMAIFLIFAVGFIKPRLVSRTNFRKGKHCEQGVSQQTRLVPSSRYFNGRALFC